MAQPIIPEWSGTHVRVRAELFITSILIFSVEHLGVSTSSMSVLPISIRDEPTAFWLKVFLFGFWAYFAVALFARTQTEKLRQKDMAFGFTSDVEALKALLVEERNQFQWLTLQVPQAPTPIIGTSELQTALWNAVNQVKNELREEQFVGRTIEELTERIESFTKAVSREAQVTRDEVVAHNDRVRKLQLLIDTNFQEQNNRRSGFLKSMQNISAEISDASKTMSRNSSAWAALINFEQFFISFWVPFIASAVFASSPIWNHWVGVDFTA